MCGLPVHLSWPLAGVDLRSPIFLAPRLQMDQVQAIMGDVFEEPLLDHLNGEPCPPPAPDSIPAPFYLPGSEGKGVASGVQLGVAV